MSATMTTAERTRAYVLKMQRSVSGANGHDTGFKAAAKAVCGFGLTPEEAFPILKEWNETCDPPWTDAELWHKLRDADKRGTEPRGSMLSDSPRFQPQTHRPAQSPKPAEVLPKEKPDRAGFIHGTGIEVDRLAKARPYLREGLTLAQERGLLVFGPWYGMDCYGAADKSGHVLELRRVDGKMFPPTDKLDERKSHAVKHSRKQWPVGILEAADFPAIALVEGMPDFLAAHYETLWEGKERHCAVVSMLSASPEIAVDALPHFKGKRVRIFPHADKRGILGAAKWKAQLDAIGASKVDIFDFGQYQKPNGEKVGDFWEAFHPKQFYPVIRLPEGMLP